MMKPKHQRLLFILIALLMMAIGATLLLRNLEEYVVYFYAPSDIKAKPPATNTYIRVGGLVKEGSVSYPSADVIHFTITDMEHELQIKYQGIVPNLFREGQGIIAEGIYQDGKITAKTILAKHDEYYMPPEVAKTLKKSGQWKPYAKENVAP